MYAVMMFQKNVWESRYVFDFRSGIFLFQTAIQKKFELISRALYFFRAEAQSAKRNERAMGTRNGSQDSNSDLWIAFDTGSNH